MKYKTIKITTTQERKRTLKEAAKLSGVAVEEFVLTAACFYADAIIKADKEEAK